MSIKELDATFAGVYSRLDATMDSVVSTLKEARDSKVGVLDNTSYRTAIINGLIERMERTLSDCRKTVAYNTGFNPLGIKGLD
jgi:hypothetical protein